MLAIRHIYISPGHNYRGHHGQARQAAFSPFGLQDHRHAAGAETQTQTAPVTERRFHFRPSVWCTSWRSATAIAKQM